MQDSSLGKGKMFDPGCAQKCQGYLDKISGNIEEYVNPNYQKGVCIQVIDLQYLRNG